MGASICCAVTEADTQFTIFALSALKKQYLIFLSLSEFNKLNQYNSRNSQLIEKWHRFWFKALEIKDFEETASIIKSQ